MITAKNLMSKNFLKIDTNDHVSKLIGHMKNKNTTFALVYQGKKYKGMIDKKFLLTSRVDTSQMKVNNILKKRSKAKTCFFVPKLKYDTTLDEICKLLATTHANALPVIEKNVVKGIVTVKKVLQKIRKQYQGLRAKDILRKRLTSALETEKIGKIIEKMHLNKIDKLPIVNRAGKLIGIATISDIMKYFHRWPITAQKLRTKGIKRVKSPDRDTGEKQDMLKTPVSNIMIPAQVCATADLETSMPLIIDMMTKENTSSVIIQEKKKPIGIITQTDLLKEYVK
ncbi:CBS domain-containing protein [Candidatus Woesearchaeota archaeon]|nr:CBS domain-containing protein [Candidatus Woesearchaeota archaeon]